MLLRLSYEFYNQLILVSNIKHEIRAALTRGKGERGGDTRACNTMSLLQTLELRKAKSSNRTTPAMAEQCS